MVMTFSPTTSSKWKQTNKQKIPFFILNRSPHSMSSDCKNSSAYVNKIIFLFFMSFHGKKQYHHHWMPWPFLFLLRKIMTSRKGTISLRHIWRGGKNHLETQKNFCLNWSLSNGKQQLLTWTNIKYPNMPNLFIYVAM